MNKYCKFLLLGIMFSQGVNADLLDTFGLKSKKKFDVVIGDEKDTELKALKVELESLEKKEQEMLSRINQARKKVSSEVVSLETQIKTEKESPYLNRKLLIYRSIKQSTSGIKSVWKDIIGTVKKHIVLLEAYVKDPNLTDLKLEKKSLYTIEDLQRLTEMISSKDDRIAHLKTQKGETQLGLDNKRKKLVSLDKSLTEKKKEQADLVAGKEKSKDSKLTIRQQADVFDAEVDQIVYEKEHMELQIQEETTELSFLTAQLYVEEKKRTMLKQKRDLMVRMSFRVDEKDVHVSQEELKKKKHDYLTVTDSYLQKIEKLSAEQDREKKQLKDMEAKQEALLKAGGRIEEWNAHPATADEYLSLGELGYRNDKFLLLEREIDLLHTQIDLEKARYEEEDTLSFIVSTWYKIKHDKFQANDDLVAETKKYEERLSELSREVSLYDDKRKAANSRLSLQNKSLANLKEMISRVHNQKKDIFRGAVTQYQKCEGCLDKAMGLITQQIEITTKLIENYSKISTITNGSIRHINAMLAELQRVSLWHRAGGAISKEGLSHLLPDVYLFMEDIKTLGLSYLSDFSMRTVLKSMKGLIYKPYIILLFLLKLLLLFLCFLFFHRYIPVVSRHLLATTKESMGQYVFSLIFASILLFIHEHLIGFYLWTVGFISFGINIAVDVYPAVLFYLCSIPYLLYLSRRFVAHLSAFNRENDYLLFSENFEQHFFRILRLFLYSTATLLFFREAFILATYTKSELPNILLAVYGVIVRILLLALPRKEDLLNAISTKNQVWSWVWRMVDQYYYFALFSLIVLMIMSDPHVGGYNNLVSYLLWGVCGSALVAKLLFSFYMFCRKSSSVIFFSSDGETLKERFSFSKTLYGISVILLFIVFLIFGFFIVAWLWDRPISLQNIWNMLNAERLTIGMSDGQFQKLSLLELFTTFAFIPMGFLVAYIVDKFVLHRIFSVLLVNPGVHNAVSTISYYVVVITVITIGLWQENLGFLVLYSIGPLLLGMVWALRDLFNDFVAYFVILINRPLKVGDYIKVSDDVQGVVRSVNPRAVVLRRKKGFSLIVPNHKLVQEVINNWDYNLNFISCPDIKVVVEYSADPEEAMAAIGRAADANLNVLKSPAPTMRLDNFEEYGFQFMIRCYISPEKTLEQWQIASEVRCAIVKELRAGGMNIAYPVRIIQTMKD